MTSMHVVAKLLHPAPLEPPRSKIWWPDKPRVLWLMVPAGVDRELATLVPLLEASDIVIDGGNSSAMRTQFGHHDEKKK